MRTQSKKLTYISLLLAAVLSATTGSSVLAAEKNDFANVNAPGVRATAFTREGNGAPSDPDVQATATDGTNRASVNADVEDDSISAGVGARDGGGITAGRATVTPGELLGF